MLPGGDVEASIWLVHKGEFDLWGGGGGRHGKHTKKRLNQSDFFRVVGSDASASRGYALVQSAAHGMYMYVPNRDKHANIKLKTQNKEGMSPTL